MIINYKKGKKRYKINNLGSLFLKEDRLKYEEPTIYIGGQLEHRMHVLEKSGYTNDAGFNMFTGNWSYDYPVTSKEKENINAIHFAETFISLLEKCNLNNVRVITASYGGMIGAYVTKSKRVKSVLSIHPPILGTILANPNTFSLDNRLNSYERNILKLCRLIVNNKYGFEQDNYLGIDLRKVDLNKLTIVGSNLNPDKDKNKLLIAGYKLIKKLTGKRSDGIVIFEPRIFNQKGINFIKEEGSLNHIEALSETNLEKVYNLSKKL